MDCAVSFGFEFDLSGNVLKFFLIVVEFNLDRSRRFQDEFGDVSFFNLEILQRMKNADWRPRDSDTCRELLVKVKAVDNGVLCSVFLLRTADAQLSHHALRKLSVMLGLDVDLLAVFEPLDLMLDMVYFRQKNNTLANMTSDRLQVFQEPEWWQQNGELGGQTNLASCEVDCSFKLI